MSLRQSHPLPSRPRPIVLIGTGGIANDAHLPAYAKAGFTVAGVFDLDGGKARETARRWRVERVLGSVEEAATAVPGCVFDVAAPPMAHEAILTALPEGAAVLVQKPLGLDLRQATAIRDVCRSRRLQAAVNFQLRFSPMMLAVADALEQGLLGRLLDIEVHLSLRTPWELFPHLRSNPRVEIVSHSVHYLDTIRALAGEPREVLARTYRFPGSGLADTRTSAILDYGDELRVTLSINHHHDFGSRFQDATFRVEGERGAALVRLGLLLDYPRGEPDELWIAARGGPWEAVPLQGGWFPDAFIGTMSNLQRFAVGEDEVLKTSVEDAWHTMALVERCYQR
ncbi:MAG TPA: Gfo/Idh/MocA family oxidoreductase [Steroidobacteraceae bacterium]|nr:Gfo/Idh/MocA family oxidoreductase [Steroidobacteraceae bacterium]